MKQRFRQGFLHNTLVDNHPVHNGLQSVLVVRTHSNDMQNHRLQERVVMYGVASIVVR